MQVAGGAMKCHNSPRKWREIFPEAKVHEETEWAVFLCMKNPLSGSNIPYVETTWNIPEEKDFNVSAFARDYQNPWLVKGMVSIGYRLHNSEVLSDLRKTVLTRYERDTVDYGSAICGWIYELLDSKATVSLYEEAESAVREFMSIAADAPHILRWKVSILFAMGELARKYGNTHTARVFYQECIEIDIVHYSPLLGNKTLDALYQLSLMSLSEGLLDEAKNYLYKSLSEIERLCKGSWLNIRGNLKSPLPFGYAELAQLIDKGSRAAYMLAEINTAHNRPGVFYSESKGFFERQLIEKDCKESELIHSVNNLRDAIFNYQSKIDELQISLSELDSHSQALAKEVAERDAYAQGLAKSLSELDSHSQALAIF